MLPCRRPGTVVLATYLEALQRRVAMHAVCAAVLVLLSQGVASRPVDSETRHANILREHIRAVASENTIIISQSLCTYLEFAENWIWHAERLGIHNYLIIAEDAATLEYINKHHPRHSVPSTLFGYSSQNISSTFKNFGDADFAALSCRRPIFLSVILRLGYNVLWTDMDTAWTESPFPLIPRQHDFVGVQEYCENGCKIQSMLICTCLMHMQPTKAMFHFLNDWHQSCKASSGIDNFNDQDHFNKVFKATGATYLQYYIMPCQVYPSGRSIDRSSLFGELLKPAWLHANWRIGKTSKREFMEEHKLWNVQGSGAFPICTE